MTQETRSDLELLGANTGNCLRVAVTLEALGLSFRRTSLDLHQGEHNSPRFLALNPFGKVPVLINRRPNGELFILTQSNAILLYLCTIRPDVLLPENDARHRALVMERFFYFLTDVIGPSGDGFYLSQNRYPRGTELLLQRTLDAITASEIFFEDNSFIAGPSFTLADIVALTIVNANSSGIAWDRVPKLRYWFSRVMERDDVSRGLAVFKN
jgi:GST-like protein